MTMNRTPAELIEAMRFCLLDGGASTFLIGDNEMARLVEAFAELSAASPVGGGITGPTSIGETHVGASSQSPSTVTAPANKVLLPTEGQVASLEMHLRLRLCAEDNPDETIDAKTLLKYVLAASFYLASRPVTAPIEDERTCLIDNRIDQTASPECPALSQREYLPDCMMPDGADPCAGYHQLAAALSALEKERDAERANAEHAYQQFLAMLKERDELRQRLDEANGVTALALGYEKTVRELRESLRECREASEGLRAVYEAAKGLCCGVDWNHGTQAELHGYRQKLIDAVAALNKVTAT